MEIITRAEAKAQGLGKYFNGNPCRNAHIAERYTRTGYCCVCSSNKQKRKYESDPEVFRERHRRWRRENPEKEQAMRGRQAARRRAITASKPLSPRRQAIKDGKQTYMPTKPCPHGHMAERSIKDASCPVCRAERAKRYKAANKDRIKEQRKEYYANNPQKDLERKQKRREYLAKNKDRIYAQRQEWLENGGQAKKTLCQIQRGKRIKTATPSNISNEDLLPIYEEAARVTKQTGVPHEVDHYYPIRGKVVCGLNVPWNMQVITKTENCAKNNKMPEEFYGPDHTPPTW
jgi:hypothetical protein